MRRRWRVLVLLGIILCLLAKDAECGILLRALVVNPSSIKTQTAVLKAYLPKEAKPEDIVDLGDLKVDYDIIEALYYVYKEFELAPGESVGRSIEIRDVWVISKAEIEALTNEAKGLVEKLKDTAHFDAAVTLQRDIESKSSEILDKQERAMEALPRTHIAVYRGNVKTLDTIKSMLARLEKMVMETKVISGPAVERVSVKATWWLILGVIIALGLLSLIFFIIWHRQAGIAELKKKSEEEMKSEELPHVLKEEGEKGS